MIDLHHFYSFEWFRFLSIIVVLGYVMLCLFVLLMLFLCIAPAILLMFLNFNLIKNK